MNDNKVVEINNLSVAFSTEGRIFKAVKNISFSLCENETVGLVGESGSGKSVTSLAIMRLLNEPPAIVSGNIFFKNDQAKPIDLLAISENEMRKYRGNDISMIFQEPMTSLNPVYKCGKQVMEVIHLHQNKNLQEAKEIALNLFDEVQLPRPNEIFNSYPFQISGGQMQRVMIAMAIACNPSLLIADEPTTALDVTVQKTVIELLKKLQQKYGMCILFITHDLGVIAEIAHKVVVLYKGDIVEQGSVTEVLNNPVHPYTKGLLACRPSILERPKKLVTVSDFLIKDVADNFNKNVPAFIPDIATMQERAANHKLLYSSQPVLKILNLKNYYSGEKNFFGKSMSFVKAVDDISFDVYKGETLGLVGESGCGKTTLGRTIIRLIEATSGCIEYNGINIRELNSTDLRRLRKNLQIIFQDPYSSLNPRLTIGDAIAEPMKIHNICKTSRERKNKVLELLLKVGLETSYYDRYPHEFSGGQRQRIGIARALAVNPEFIICDESVSALDVSVQAQVLNLLNSLKAEFQLTYIFISHDLAVVKYMADRIIVMNQGKIEEIGEADQIFYNPQSDYTKKLIDAIPDIKMKS